MCRKLDLHLVMLFLDGCGNAGTGSLMEEEGHLGL